MKIIENLLDLIFRPAVPKRLTQEEKDSIVRDARLEMDKAKRKRQRLAAKENAMSKRTRETR